MVMRHKLNLYRLRLPLSSPMGRGLGVVCGLYFWVKGYQEIVKINPIFG